ncbi:MAG: Inner membrane protein YebS [Candidatus Accumulibacter appositus]|uniref:Inner membrane protein YebS n=1 Tax=Candidatus Accumulibacter appositus TaxID=1454003 RepID=A0A011PSD8_9PROT|nr:paraquat-inducible protein A [Accumulibacter sp.]EXI79902.1 MAG: Inner membrane protein YebS [Candidatus Accumulibacter appositus]HRF05464.1 paraquat-inducible protein A [Accumulibacter sp.]
MSDAARSSQPLMACQECDLLQRIPVLPVGGRARCARCGFVLAARPRDPLELPLVLTLTALIVFVVANAMPLMDLSAVGRYASTTILGGARQMWLDGERITAMIVVFCAVIAPALYLLMMLAVLLAARRPPLPHWSGELLRWGLHMQPWAMYDVMLLGILVALIKIAQLATVDPGVGLFAMGLLALLLPAISVTFDAREVWKRVEWKHGDDLAAAFADGNYEERGR